jgi:PIN domain nuclease of toxin-antitoxin system
MSYLLDTHILLWFFEDSKKLTDNVNAVLDDKKISKYVSLISLWEFTIKHSIGKLKFDDGVVWLHQLVKQNGFILLPIKELHIFKLAQLPLLHKDPFDRLLVATAIVEKLTIITADVNIHNYKTPILW